ncbi:MAG: MFS transporter [Polyangiaceae bacterium]
MSVPRPPIATEPVEPGLAAAPRAPELALEGEPPPRGALPESLPPPSTAAGKLVRALTSWRTASVSLLSFSSGLPLGLVYIAIPDWLFKSGVDIKTVGLITLVQFPWMLKVVWSPLLDRYTPPWLGRRRGWAAVAQVALMILGFALAGVGDRPDAPWIIGALAMAIAFASATQDIAIDAYAVDVLRADEQGIAVGAKTAIYRGAMYVSGGLAITAAGAWSWPVVNVGLALLFVPMLVITVLAPEPRVVPPPARSLQEAVWAPLAEIVRRPRALEILAFVVCYKLADNLAGALLRPFLAHLGYSDFDRGVTLATVALAATLIGTFLGAALTTVIGLGHALWIFGFLQALSNIGYLVLADSPPDRGLLVGAMGFENLTQGMGTGAFSVLLFRLTQKRFSATQYALFTCLFSLPRLASGPISGILVDRMGWTNFLWMTIAACIPGLLLLQRFVPLGAREPTLEARPAETPAS